MEALERLEALSVCLSVTLSHGLSVHLSLCMGPFQEGSAALAAQAWDVAAKRQVHTPSGSPAPMCFAALFWGRSLGISTSVEFPVHVRT